MADVGDTVTTARLPIVMAALIITATAARAKDHTDPWSFGVSLQGYDVPRTEDYFCPLATADRGALHLEARYQYEALDTGSFWVGANFSAGQAWSFGATMMLGAVFGDLDGVAPGYRITLDHRWFHLESEGEYFASVRAQTDGFLYDWTQVSGAPLSWLRLGLSTQRTRAYDTGLSVQFGPYVRLFARDFDVAVFFLNPWSDERVYTAAVSFGF